MAGCSSPPNPDCDMDAKKASLCEECLENKWKYRCPGCGIVTCSLPCVKSHKHRTGCTGKRPRTDFVPISQFDDKTLLSDYSLLEETKRVADLAHRMGKNFGSNYVQGLLPPRLRFLRKVAYRRNTKLYFLPKGMSRNESNKTRFDQRSNCIHWTLEWKFNSIDTSLIDHNVSEKKSFESIIEKHLSPTPWNDKFTPYRNATFSDLRFFIKKQAKESNSAYRELDAKLPISPQLRNILILEYPVILVFLPTETPDFEIQKYEAPVRKETGTSNPDLEKCEGRVFKEEEMEEGETRIVDLVDREDRNNEGRVFKEEEIEEEESFDFEEEVKQAYSDLIGEMNPDDFLCSDSDTGNEGKRDELEEGEIPDCL